MGQLSLQVSLCGSVPGSRVPAGEGVLPPPPTWTGTSNPRPSQMSNGSDSIVSFRHDSAEMDHSENEDITIKRADGTDKVLIRDRFWSLPGPPGSNSVSPW